MGNQIKTTTLLAVLTAVILWIGQLLGGQQGMLIALILAAGMNFFSYWCSDKLVLRMYHAQETAPQQAPELHEMVSQLTRKAGLPMPILFSNNIFGCTVSASNTNYSDHHYKSDTHSSPYKDAFLSFPVFPPEHKSFP